MTEQTEVPWAVPALPLRPTGRTRHEVTETAPEHCPAGHPLRVGLVGWAPCGCDGHRLVWCRCGEVVHVLQEHPKGRCSVETRPMS